MSEHPVCLIVDDEPHVRTYLTVVLRSGGFETIEADNGIQALTTLRTTGRKVDLVVSDVCMPIMSGHALASCIRTEFPQTPVILITGYTATPASEGSRILQKPFLPAALLGAASEALGRARA